MPQDGPSQMATGLNAWADWLSARATLVLVLLMVQLGLVVALARLSLDVAPRTAAGASRGTLAACGAFEVVFARGADMGEVRQWALNFQAQVVAGPNERGAFELSVPQLSLGELRQALGPLAEQVRANPLCPAGAPA